MTTCLPAFIRFFWLRLPLLAGLAACQPTPSEQPDTLVDLATVQSGPRVQADELNGAIARARYGDGVMYVQVFEANLDRIRNPDLIYPGQDFVLPQIEMQ